jgi:hypothetical protein
MSSPFNSPPTPAPYPPAQGDATGGVIPYKNMPALLAYYLGIFSLLCCFIATPLGIVPIVLGVIGLQKRAANPAIHGTAHAWIGIVLGALNVVVSLLFIVLALLGAFSQ